MSAGTVTLVEEVLAGSELLVEAPRLANLVPNPSFEVDLTSWTTNGGTTARVVANASDGTASLSVVATSSGNGRDNNALAVEDGKRYYFRAFVHFGAGSGNASLRISNAAGTQKAIASRAAGSGDGILEGEFVADETAANWKVRALTVTPGTAWDLNYDAVMVVEIQNPGETPAYVDGAKAGYAWEGTAHVSRTKELGVLYVADPTDLQPEGGELLVAELEEKGYSAVDEVTGRVTLDSNLSGSFLAGDRVDALPLSTERFAHVQLEEQDEVLIARVPHALYDRLPVGARDEAIDDAELVELGRAPGGEVIVADVLNREPIIDAGFLDPTTTPGIPTSDGLAPSSSPTPVVAGGVDSLFVSWTPIANHDLVVYEVHVSTSSGFTPGVGTFAGETPGNLLTVFYLPGTTTPPAYGTTYFVRVVAKDEDGIATFSPQVSGSPAQITGPDIAVNAVTAGKIAANAVTAATLESILALTSALMAGTPSAQRVEIGYGTEGGIVDPSFIGIRAFAVDGTTQTFRVDAITGEVYVKGRVDWGSNSRLLGNDVLEIAQQTALAFVTPARVQSASGSTGPSTTGPVTWPSPTQAGNLLLLTVLTRAANATPPTVTTPAGWTAVTSVSGQDPVSLDFLRLSVFKIENAASRSGQQAVAFSGSSAGSITHIFEYYGADIQDVAAGPVDVEATSSGKSTTVTSGTPPTPTQAAELWFASLAINVNVAGGASDTLTSPTNGYSLARTSRDGSVLMRLTEYERAVTSIASPAMQATAAYSAPFLGVVVAFKAKAAPANVPADSNNVVKHWARDVSGTARPHFTLEDGTALAVVGGKAGEAWELELVGVSVNLTSMAPQTADTRIVTGVTGLEVGDYVMFLNKLSPHRSLIIRALPITTTAGEIEVQAYNTDTVTIDPPADTFYFLVVHRS